MARISTIWIRTWFGNDGIDRAEADRAYTKLCEHVGEPGDLFFSGAVFEDESFADRVNLPIINDVTPSYLLKVYALFPNLMEGGSLGDEEMAYIETGNGTERQKIMVAVADKRACETGAVLLLAVNGFGNMTNQRLRVMSGKVKSFNDCWVNLGQGLEENFRPDEFGEVDFYLEDGAWGSFNL